MKSSPRPETLRSVYRWIAAALVVLWGLPLVAVLWYPATASPQPETNDLPMAIAMARVHTADTTADEAAHRKVCSCANCPGGKHCCCGAADSPQEGFVIRAMCDSTPASVVGIPAAKIAFFTTTQSVSLPGAMTINRSYTDGNDTALSHLPTPFSLPPRLS